MPRNDRGILEIKQLLIKDGFIINKLFDNIIGTTYFFTFKIESRFKKNRFSISDACTFPKTFMETDFNIITLDNVCSIIQSDPEIFLKKLKDISGYLNSRTNNKDDKMLDYFNNVYGDLFIFI